MKHKFGAVRTKIGEKSYASKLEARYAEKLELFIKSKELLFYLEQVPFRLSGNIIYRLDFMEFWANGDIICSECKGMETPEWKLKYKLFQESYPWIQLNIIKK